MKEPIITWYVKEGDGGYRSKESHHAGTYNKSDKVAVDIQVWNNRWGVEDVSHLTNPVVNFYFDTLEDSALLEMCVISVDDMGSVPLVIKDKKASARLGRSLNGKANDGNDRLVVNQPCYANIRFEFEAGSYRLKENDLKNIYFELVSMD